MKIYNKRLNNLEELRKEQRALKKKLKRLQNDPAPKSKKQAQPAEVMDKLGIAINLLSDPVNFMKSTPTLLIPLAISLLKTKKVQHTLKNVAMNVGGGYLKWKALTLGLKFTRQYIAHRRQKAKEKKEA